jgi:hypothetical protein
VKKEKGSCERLPDSQNSIVKKERVRREKEKFRVKGFLIARIPS